MEEKKLFDTSLYKKEIKCLFDINDIPENVGDVSEETYKIRKEVIDTYVTLTQDSLKTLNYCCDSLISKPLTMFYLFYYLELYFKTYILVNYPVDVFDVDKYEHEFTDIIKYIIDNSKINFEGFYARLKKIKNRDGETINYTKFSDFKYNRAKDSNRLIFDLSLSKEDVKNIKDVITWIENHM